MTDFVDPARERALRTRPPGWVPPGPQPKGAEGRADLLPGDDEDLSYLCGDFRIFQHKRGHRWSLDDFVTAAIAIEQGRRRTEPVTRAADLGCGIGSVLMMVAWAFPEATLRGVEAQDVSLGMARRSVAFNGLESRVRVDSGDLRDPNTFAGESKFQLVTGTPPYIPLGAGLVSEKVQRGPCCFETRGGIEDYALRAATLLDPSGLFVACAGAFPESRPEEAMRRAGLAPLERVDVIPREGKPVLFRVVVATPANDESRSKSPLRREFVVRDLAGRITPAMIEMRALLGMPPLAREKTG